MTKGTSPARRSWTWVLAASVVLGVAFAARLYRIDAQSLWHDEGLSWWFARQPLPQLIAGVAGTEHPPAYFFLLGIWMRLAGDSAFALRFLSVWAGVLAVALVMGLARQWRLPWTGFLAGSVLAIHPFHIWYSQEVRSYAWMAALAVALTWLAWRWLRRLDWKEGWLYAALGVFSLYVHIFMGFLLAVHFVVGVLPRWFGAPAQRRWRMLLPYVGIAAFFLPWLFPTLAQVRTNRTYWYWGFLDLPVVLDQTLLAFAFFGFPRYVTVPHLREAAYIAWLLVAAATLHVWHRPYGPLWAGSVWGVLALTLAWAYVVPKYDPRYAIDALPLWVLLLAYPVGEIVAALHRRRQRVATSLVVLGSVLLLAGYAVGAWASLERMQEPPVARPDFRQPVTYVAQHAAPGDAVVLVGGHIEPIVRYYLRRSDVTVYPMPRRLLVDLDRLLTWWDVAPALNEMTRRHSQVWLIRWQEDLADPQHLVYSLLTARACSLPVPGFGGEVDVKAYEVVRPFQLPGEPTPSHPVGITFRNGLHLVGYDAARVFDPSFPASTCRADRQANPSEIRVAPGETLLVILYLEPRARLVQGFAGFVHLVTPDGSRALSIMDRWLGGYAFPPFRWPVGQVILQEFPVAIPLDTPPGEYALEVGLYFPETMQRIDPLPKVVPGARTDGSRILMGPVFVVPR